MPASAESSTLINHLLKGTTNSAIDWIQVWTVWGHMWGSMNVTCSRRKVRRCVPGSVWRRAVLLQTSVQDASASPAGCDRYFRQ